MRGFVFHTLKGIPGWSYLTIGKIDVAKVISIGYSKRLFMITDRKFPYNLEISYENPHDSVRGGFSASGHFVAVNGVELKSEITKRYQTEAEVVNEINEIKSKQKKLKDWQQQLESTILESIKSIDSPNLSN